MIDLEPIETSLVDGTFKGVPPGQEPTPLSEIGSLGWNVLSHDVPFPAAVIHEPTLRRNSRWMKEFARRTGVSLCPHGKTTMAPQLFALQEDDGAWGFTAATPNHLAVYRRFGISRVIYANQLMGRSALSFVFGELRTDPDFDFYCVVDSRAHLDDLIWHLNEEPVGRPLQLLLEIGVENGRCGLRDPREAVALAKAIKEAAPLVTLRGVETFEGIVVVTTEEGRKSVDRLLDTMKSVVEGCDAGDLFGEGEVLLTAGGSAHFDEVVRRLRDIRLSRDRRIVLRSSCYLTHDVNFYGPAYDFIKRRSADVAATPGDLRPALEVWGLVQSTPEPNLAIVTIGKRDVSHDCGLPALSRHLQAGDGNVVVDASAMGQVVALNDQHAYIRLHTGQSLAVGDLVSFGISHPCTTFDKWQLLYLVDDEYNINGAIRTFF